MDAHNAAVAKVAERVRHFHARQQPFRLYHGSTNSTRQSHRHADNTVDTSRLDHILSVDKERMTALAEPNVPLDALLAETLRHGLMPYVVMELPGITVGGGFSGTSGESSSFRYGAFDATMESIEIVVPDGTITRASRTEKPDLFWGAASAFGTLGVVTLLEVRLKKAAPYVALSYHHCTSAAQMVDRMRAEIAREDNDFVDGIVYAMDSTVICTGRLTDELPQGVRPRTFSKPGDLWFYLRAEQTQAALRRGEAVVDCIPLTDYLFRYDRGGFWTGMYAFKYFVTPFNRITRRALNRFMHTRVMYRALHKSGLSDAYVIQDVGVPYDSAAEFQQWLHDNLGLYPLWLCPLRVRRDDPDAAHGLHAEFADPTTLPELLNYGVWGPVAGGRDAVVRKNRALENKVQACGGKKWLYAHAYYTEEEFWSHYQKDSYFALREKYGAGYLPTVYDKVKVDVESDAAARQASLGSRFTKKLWDVWPLRGLYGVYCAATGGDYLMQKKKVQAELERQEREQHEKKKQQQQATEAAIKEKPTEEATAPAPAPAQA
jgi:FAD/FMN-containing dehydrogenase